MKVAALILGVAAALLLVGCSSSNDVEERVAVLEAELAERPTIGDLIVVGKEWEVFTGTRAYQACISYRAFEQIGRTCVAGSDDDGIHANVCYNAAIIGQPLPDSCHLLAAALQQ